MLFLLLVHIYLYGSGNSSFNVNVDFPLYFSSDPSPLHADSDDRNQSNHKTLYIYRMFMVGSGPGTNDPTVFLCARGWWII